MLYQRSLRVTQYIKFLSFNLCIALILTIIFSIINVLLGLLLFLIVIYELNKLLRAYIESVKLKLKYSWSLKKLNRYSHRSHKCLREDESYIKNALTKIDEDIDKINQLIHLNESEPTSNSEIYLNKLRQASSIKIELKERYRKKLQELRLIKWGNWYQYLEHVAHNTHFEHENQYSELINQLSRLETKGNSHLQELQGFKSGRQYIQSLEEALNNCWHMQERLQDNLRAQQVASILRNVQPLEDEAKYNRLMEYDLEDINQSNLPTLEDFSAELKVLEEEAIRIESEEEALDL